MHQEVIKTIFKYLKGCHSKVLDLFFVMADGLAKTHEVLGEQV